MAHGSPPNVTPLVISRSGAAPRIMVHIVAYNASSTLSTVLDRIPLELRPRLSEICVFDDASTDDTFLVGKGYQQVREMPQLRVFRNAVNRGYGGNQKLGYRYAIDNGFDIVVLLHGDGQYAPEAMSNLLQPIIDGEADAVFGSRMMEKGAARRGGMPLYKYVGNRILTRFENAVLGMDLSEFHSGYRVYSVEALKRIPFESNSDDFHFDTQIIIQLQSAGLRIKEIPIPTYYGDEICRVNGTKYAIDVARSVLEFRLHEAGVVDRPEYRHVAPAPYAEKFSPFSSHRRILETVPGGSKVLDVGCAGGYLARKLGEKGCDVIGVDVHDDAEARAACSRFYVHNLDGGTWAPDERDFDRILFADVLEHLRDTSILERARDWLKPGGEIVASTGNIALWFMRLALLTGKFQYSPRGILDETHVKLYTRDTFRALIENAGYSIKKEDWTVIPIEKLASAVPALEKPMVLIDSFQYALARTRPELFAYQFVVQAEPR
jgi:glycosyltransferase involved in cell wall biosynthesis/protein-L-isoaspartate O-methyltransferase